MRLYILSTYQEDGAENVRVTTKENIIALKDKLDSDCINRVSIETKNWIEPNKSEYMARIKQYIQEEMETLNKLVHDDVILVDGKNLSSGWGGYMLHIVDLE